MHLGIEAHMNEQKSRWGQKHIRMNKQMGGDRSTYKRTNKIGGDRSTYVRTNKIGGDRSTIATYKRTNKLTKRMQLYVYR